MTDYDVVVIGSGAGGLTAALCLARAGHRVLVLEQHYLPGGWCHSFSMGGYRFSPGVHYLGEMEPGGRANGIVEGLGLARDLEFYELNPDGYDHIFIGDERFDIPRGKKVLAERLKRRFPREAAGIDGYLDTCDRIQTELGEHLEFRNAIDAIALPWRAPAAARWGMRSARSFIHHFARDPLLRSLLASQSGDHGLPPSMASATVHASVTAHYFNGGVYPTGGGAAIPRAFIRALRQAGGHIRVKTAVASILVEGRRAIGVKLADGTVIRSQYVVSNADPGVTFGRLIGREHLSRATRRKLDRTRYSVSALSLFMATDLDLRAAGLDSGNYWLYDHHDMERIYQDGLRSTCRQGSMGLQFVTATTLKDPSKDYGGRHTLESFVPVSYDSFGAWACARTRDYASLKRELTDMMLEGIERLIPGFRRHVVFAELGTPLTNEYYCAATRGSLYGTEKSIFRVGPWGYPLRTEFEGLFMCGASTISHGVLGGLLSGLLAARAVVGGTTNQFLEYGRGKIRIASAEHPPQPAVDLEPLEAIAG